MTRHFTKKNIEIKEKKKVGLNKSSNDFYRLEGKMT